MASIKPNPSEQELEAIISRQLSAMPGRKAPVTLGPKVMAAIQAKTTLAWWHKPIGYWSMPAQILIVAAMVISAVAVTLATSWLTQKGMPWLESGYSSFLAFWDNLQTLSNAGAIIVRSGLQTWIRSLLGIAFLMYLLCLGAGTAIVRVANKK